ncbi:MarR family winged helix-turn-helix transcriptional regulator [Homoserinibacter sp. YIM 151385]|uniref:MarR family winged helix-turn-helix transcriptional regulator n=1 Tax=Homoserinibacter sp. YIM 151385 TaxID=2985506 RepID=UPI0022F00BD2|nr:MarR family transcriptional regulator [Homoserinibacter sp. YIM 151385]WBU37163.1 MarR family transcriptional regulator [Homoserinibacter sp. YIM 151385]
MVDATGIGPEEWTSWRSFLSMQGQLARALDRQLQRDSDISHADFSVLVTIWNAENRQLRVGELASLLAWEKSRVSHQVTRMETRGLLERSDCADDARATWIGLTFEGRRTILHAIRGHAADVRRLYLDLLTPEELEVMERASRRVLDTLDPAVCELLDAPD